MSPVAHVLGDLILSQWHCYEFVDFRTWHLTGRRELDSVDYVEESGTGGAHLV